MCVRVKSLSSCSTLRDPMDCSPPDSSVCGILQERILEWIAISSSRGKEYWRGLPSPPPGDLPNPGIEPRSLMSPALADRFFTTEPTRKLPPTHTHTAHSIKDYGILLFQSAMNYLSNAASTKVVGKEMCRSFHFFYITPLISKGSLRTNTSHFKEMSACVPAIPSVLLQFFSFVKVKYYFFKFNLILLLATLSLCSWRWAFL